MNVPPVARRLRRRGLTLIEILVVITIIGILIALTLPAIQSARESARRAQCLTNMTQLTLAAHVFETENGGFPSWATGRVLADRTINYCSIHSMLLPAMGNTPLFNSINFNIGTLSIADLSLGNYTSATTSIQSFLCPSDSRARAGELALNSYRANAGLAEVDVQRAPSPGSLIVNDIEAGSFVIHKKLLPLSEFTDGTSNTVAFSEKLIGTGAEASASSSRDWVDVPLSVEMDIDARTRFCSRLAGPLGWRQDSGGTCFYMSDPPNSRTPDCGGPRGNGFGIFAARSQHPGGVNVTMADGSGRWVTATINLSIWRALGTRNRGDL
jgi:prepilin-type N-terminal cleavage/methylation domain-containing protein/prepilin-type processing-associated H-X9-DG protein